jgi:ribosomal small subunit protein bTHX
MGKGDIKSRRGKIYNGSYGARRLRRKKHTSIVAKAEATVETKIEVKKETIKGDKKPKTAE